jgi:multiple sugar transport system permease protein/sn-glycerol 3-phosphate transport system permease protein
VSNLEITAARSARGKERARVRRREATLAWAMLAPSIVILGVFVVGPALLDIPLSLMRYDIISGSGRWLGSGNFNTMFADQEFWDSLIHTLELTLGTAIPMLVLSLFLGLLLNQKLRGVLAYRTVVFAPYVIPMVGASVAWIWLLSGDGLINYLLQRRGPGWLDNSQLALPGIMLMTIWQFTGYYTMLVLGGLQSIPHELEEAAAMDGASGRRLVWSVILPLLSPTLLFSTIVIVIHSFQVFDQIFVMTGGGPGTGTVTLVYYLYKQGFVFFNTGQAAAVSVLLLLGLGGITWLQMNLSRKWVNYDL